MNKKLLSAILFGALAASTSTFVSCKDYDDDIDRLQLQIDQNATTAANDLASKIAALESQIGTLNSAKETLAGQLATAKEEAAAAAANALEAAKGAQGSADANSKALSDAVARVAVLETKVSSLEAIVADLQTAKADLTAKVSDLQTQMAAVKADTKANADAIAAANAEILAKYSELSGKISEVSSALGARIDVIDAALNTIKSNYVTKDELATKAQELAAMDAQIQAQTATNLKYIETLQATVKELGLEDTELQKQISDMAKDLAAATASISALQTETAALRADLANLQAKQYVNKDELNEAKVALEKALAAADAKLTEAVAKAQALADANAADIAAIKEAVATKAEQSDVDALAASLTLTQADVMNITLGLTELKGQIAAQDAELKSLIADAKKEANDYAYDLVLKLTEMVNANTGNIASNTAAIATLQEVVADLADIANGSLSSFITSEELDGQIGELWNGVSMTLENYVSKADLKRLYADRAEMNDSLNVLKEAINTHEKAYNERVSAIEEEVESLKTYLTDLGLVNTAVSKRLTSITLVPSTYVDGIEAIIFKTLKYDIIKNNKKVYYYLNNATDNKAVYRMNPSGVTVASIDSAKAKFVANKATNIQTRASIASPIKVTSLKLDKDGDLVVGIQKTVNESFEGTNDNFYIAALSLPINKDYWTVENENAVVQSEYVRLHEYTFTPQLHATKLKNDDAHVHLWTTDELTGAANVDKNVYQYVAYDETLDLMELVNVCEDIQGHPVCDYESYGLKLEFDFYTNEQGDNETENEKFAYFTDDAKTKIASCVYDGGKTYTMNPAAIGREPIIRVRLVDTKNGNNIVDEAYLKIKWNQETVSPEDVELGELTDGVIYDYNCEGFEWKLGTVGMNQMIYGAENVKMSSEEFHNVYVDMALSNTGVGTVTPVIDNINGVTSYNLLWTVTAADFQNAITNFNGDKVLEAKCTWEANNGRGDINFTLKMTIRKPVYGIYGYNTAYWTNGVFQMNPIVYGTDKAKDVVTINTDLVSNGFNGRTNAPAADMVDVVTVKNFKGQNVESAEIVFDDKKFENTIGKGYSVADDGKTLKKGSEIAARIIEENGAQVLVLEESGSYGTADYGVATSLATEAAKTLVGKEVPVKVVVDPCGDNKYKETVLNYNVAIKNPFDISSDLKDVFYETTVGGSYVNVSEALEMVDWNKYVVAAVPDGSMSNAEKHKYTQSLYDYYAISNIEWATADAKTNIKAVKEGDKTNLVPTAGFTGTTWPDGASFSYDQASNSLVYKNNGATLGKEFIIICPVKVTYKWGVLTANVEITVKPGSGIE